MTKVFILAAGSQERWGLSLPKQMVPIGDEILIHRTMRQVRDRGQEPVVAAVEPMILNAVNGAIVPDDRRWTVETALCCVEGGRGRQIVLLGDVVYTNDAMDAIFSCEDSCRVFLRASLEGRVAGFYREIFGFSFDDRAKGDVVDALNLALAHAVAGGAGKLREFYCLYCGMHLSTDGCYDLDNLYVHWPIDDYTDDIDSIEDYEAFVSCVVAPGLIDTRH